MTTHIEDTLGSAGITLDEFEHHGPARRTCATLRIKQGMDVVNVEPSQARALAKALHLFAAKHEE